MSYSLKTQEEIAASSINGNTPHTLNMNRPENSPQQKTCTEFQSYKHGVEWVDMMKQVLGEASSIINPETYPGTMDETAIYYFAMGDQNNPSVSTEKNTLIIKRSRIGHNRDFRVYGITISNGQQHKYECQNVSHIQFDEIQGLVRFFNGDDLHFPTDYLGIVVSRTGNIDWLMPHCD